MKRDAVTFATDVREIRHFHLFVGLGGGAKGFNQGEARVGNMQARFRCLGGVDVDPAAIRDFHRMAGVPGTVLDLFDREQYVAFHGKEPPSGWREATPADIQRAAGGEFPNIVFLSAPCKGFSGLLSAKKSLTDKYQALNRLTVRGVWLTLEAFKDNPPEFILFENVPMLATRGRKLLDRIQAMLRPYGYAVAETTHDCGRLGGLAQSRKRFLLVSRHIDKVPPMLYQPDQKRLLTVGDLLGRTLLPGDLRAGPMHRVPNLQWGTWVRLAFVEAGADWRSLNRLQVQDGVLKDYLIVPCGQEGSGGYGVRRWDEPTGTVAGRSGPTNGAFSVADPRTEVYRNGFGVMGWDETAGAVAGESLPSNGRFCVADPRPPADANQLYQQYGVRRWDDTSGAITGQAAPGGGTYSVADPRPSGTHHNNVFRVVRWDDPSVAITGGTGKNGGCVADPRGGEDPAKLHRKFRVSGWDEASGAVIAGYANGAFAVADPRSGLDPERGAYLTGGHYGVVPWDGQSGAVSAAASHDNGRWSVADPRMPSARDHLACVIQAEDGTWHRPFTTYECAVLQSLVEPEEALELDGLNDQEWRERIGNAVPPKAAKAIADEMGRTLLLAWSGETFQLSATPIWVRNLAVAISVAGV